MGLLAWYHKRNVLALSLRNPDISLSTIQGDYYRWQNGDAGMVAVAVPNGERTARYAADLISTADGSFPSRLKRFILDVSDALFSE